MLTSIARPLFSSATRSGARQVAKPAQRNALRMRSNKQASSLTQSRLFKPVRMLLQLKKALYWLCNRFES